MKIFFPILLLTFIFGCNGDQRLRKNRGDLNYSAIAEQSDFLSANVYLTANVKSQELLVELKLNNPGSKPISIQEITVNAEGGLRSFPEGGSIKPIILEAGKDTFTTVKFKPVNDLKVYMITGKQGCFKPGYKISVFYKVQGNEKMFTMDLEPQMSENDYKAYIGKYKTPFIGYSFNTGTSFAQIQREYLETLKLSSQPFTYVSQQELALTGLNLWMKGFCERDSINAELIIVNHEDYAVKIIPDSLDFVVKGDTVIDRSKTVVLEKISGSKRDKTIMEKGDKVLIHFKKYYKNTNKKISLSLKHAFVLSGSKPLFNDDIELIKIHLP
jgi:hypothetical protein